MQAGQGDRPVELDRAVGNQWLLEKGLVAGERVVVDGFQRIKAGDKVTPVEVDLRAKARMQGYEGDPCGECGNYTLVRNGTCMKCNTCGGTSGCS